MGLKEPWRSVAIGGTITVVCVVMLYQVWRSEQRWDRQEAINERREAGVVAREAAFIQALQTNQQVFTGEVREVRERADKRADLQASEVRNLAQEIRISQAEQKNVAQELRRLADSLIRTGGAIERAVGELPQKDKKPKSDGPDPDMTLPDLGKLWHFPRWGVWPTTAPRVMPELAPPPRVSGTR
jgi:hypothetical protein